MLCCCMLVKASTWANDDPSCLNDCQTNLATHTYPHYVIAKKSISSHFIFDSFNVSFNRSENTPVSGKMMTKKKDGFCF